MYQVKSFTLTRSGTAKAIVTKSRIDSKVKDFGVLCSKNIEYKALWDTGATISGIRKDLVGIIGLLPTGTTKISTANGLVDVNTYKIDIELTNGILVEDVDIVASNIEKDCDLIIGMDIISRGDFAITNKNGNTVFSFRYPSIGSVDFTDGTI